MSWLFLQNREKNWAVLFLVFYQSWGKSRHVHIYDECAEVMATKKGLGPKISCHVSRKINSEGLLVFVQMDNRAMHLNEVPLGCDRARLCLGSSPAIVPHCSDVFLCFAQLPDALWTAYSWLNMQILIGSLKLKALTQPVTVFLWITQISDIFRLCDTWERK